MNRIVKAGTGLAVCWAVCMAEWLVYGTAWGGPFTILIAPLFYLMVSGIVVLIAMLAGWLLLIPGIKGLWKRCGWLSMLPVVAAALVMIFANDIGLRKVDPVSNYKLMNAESWSICLFCIVFPIVNFPLFDKKPVQRHND